MAEFVHKIGKGSLFKRSNKEKESQPDWDGSGMQKCPHCNAEYPIEIGGWQKTTSKGSEMISLSSKPKQQGGENRAPQVQQQQPQQQSLRDAEVNRLVGTVPRQPDLPDEPVDDMPF